MSDPGDEKLDASETPQEPEESLRSMLRGALREEGPAPDVLAGVQKKFASAAGANSTPTAGAPRSIRRSTRT